MQVYALRQNLNYCYKTIYCGSNPASVSLGQRDRRKAIAAVVWLLLWAVPNRACVPRSRWSRVPLGHSMAAVVVDRLGGLAMLSRWRSGCISGSFPTGHQLATFSWLSRTVLRICHFWAGGVPESCHAQHMESADGPYFRVASRGLGQSGPRHIKKPIDVLQHHAEPSAWLCECSCVSVMPLVPFPVPVW